MHKTVLLKETIDGLSLVDKKIFLDATLNGGGLSCELARRFGDKLKIIGIDLDQKALDESEKKLKDLGANFYLWLGNFRKLDEALKVAGEEKVDAVIFDLGLSSNQLESSGRGFTFQKDEPLIMTFSSNPTESDLTAKDIVNNWDKENLITIISIYGEESFAERISEAIVKRREEKPISTTFELREVIENAIPRKFWPRKISPATKTFQALRIAVNDEIGSIEEGLSKAFELLSAQGRMAVISFHSIEDRLVKNFFRMKEKDGRGCLVNKKPIVPSVEELKENRRARSAKLRILEKVK